MTYKKDVGFVDQYYYRVWGNLVYRVSLSRHAILYTDFEFKNVCSKMHLLQFLHYIVIIVLLYFRRLYVLEK